MATFDFKDAQELGRVFKTHRVKYLFFGKSGAILLGYSDTTQDVVLYLHKGWENCEKVVASLLELGFRLTQTGQEEIGRGKGFVQLRNGPFNLDLIFAPDGIDRFEDAWKRRVKRHGLPIASLDNIIGSKKAANRRRDREALPRLVSFKRWLEKNQ